MGVHIERVWAMPNRNTFSIKPISELLREELTEGTWLDPFAGDSVLPNIITNDLNVNKQTDYHMDALYFLKMFKDNSVDGVLYDPPYSPRQVKECYDGIGGRAWDGKSSFWSNTKNEIARIIKHGGKAICFGWNSMGIGMKNGFVMTRILLVPHGSHHNDTICTVEVKGNPST